MMAAHCGDNMQLQVARLRCGRNERQTGCACPASTRRDEWSNGGRKRETARSLLLRKHVDKTAIRAASASTSAASSSASAETTRNATAHTRRMSGRKTKVAYQGAPGAYSEAASKIAYSDCELLPCKTFDNAFTSVEQWIADRAVLPIENSLGGSIHRNYDLLFEHDLHIVGEVSLPVKHCLLAKKDVKIDQVTRVMSHPQALSQCENYLSSLGVIKEEAVDTALSAKIIADDTGSEYDTVAAVASREAAELYGLDVLDSDIQDDSDNVTRFIAIAKEPFALSSLRSNAGSISATPFKTSIVFSLDEGPGALFRALAVFALRDIDLTKIESRPTPAGMVPIVETAGNGSSTERRFKYVFYVDFAESMDSRNVQNALRHLQEFAPFVRVLGSYPRDMQLGKIDNT